MHTEPAIHATDAPPETGTGAEPPRAQGRMAEVADRPRGRLVTGVLVMLVAAWAGAAWSIVDGRQREHAEAAEAAEDLADAGAATLDAWLELEIVRLTTGAETQLRGAVSDDLLTATVTPLGRPFALLLAADGPELLATHPSRELDADQLVADFEHIRSAVDGLVGAAPIATAEGRPGVAIAVPFIDLEGQRRVLSSVAWFDETAIADALGPAAQFDVLTGLEGTHLELRTPEGTPALTSSGDRAPGGPTSSADTSSGHTVVASVAPGDEGHPPLSVLLLLLTLGAGAVAVAVVMIERSARAAHRAGREAAALARTRADFVAIVTHEVRNPLMVVTGMLDLLTAKSDQLDPTAREQLLVRAHGASRRLQGVVQDVMTSTLAERGVVEPAPHATDIAEIVASAVLTSRLRGNPDLVVDVPDGLHLHTDAGLSSRIIANLLDNAAKYGAAPFVIRGSETVDGFVLEVSDHGAGIDDVARAFSAYGQGTETTERRAGGVGLGLHLSVVIANALRGRLEHERVDGRTVFRLRLPRSI